MGQREGQCPGGVAMLLQECRGVQACAAHGVLTFGRCVPEHASDELVGVQPQGLALLVAVVQVGQRNLGLVQPECAFGGQWAALHISREVDCDGTSVGIRRVDLDVEVLAVERLQDGEPVLRLGRCGQLQAMLAQGQSQRGQQLAAKQMLEGAQRQQEAGPATAPLVVGVDATGGDQAVHVRVMAQGAAPGVQSHQQAWRGAEQAWVGTELKQAQSGAVEEQLVEPGAVELPQHDEFVRQGEHDMEVRAGQQALELSGQPLLARTCGAARATAMATGVELGDAVVALSALEHVVAQIRAEAVADAPGRARLARMQRSTARIGVEVFGEDVLKRATHDHCAKTARAA